MIRKYLFFCGTLCSGGAERVISILSKELIQNCDREVEILIYYDRDPFYPIDPRIKITRVQRETGSDSLLKNALFIRKYFKDFRGVILSFLAPFNMLALLAHIGQRGPVIVADCNDPGKVPSNFLLRSLRNILYCLADGIVLQTETNQSYFSAIVRRKSVVIYNPVAMRGQEGMALWTEKKKEIVTVARLVPQKNHKLLIDAFEIIAADFPEWKMSFIGDGPERQNLSDYISGKDLSDKITLCGEIVDVPARISGSEIFALPSDFEGLPNALIEAMCLGLPVIATKVSGSRDLIADSVNGMLVEAGDVEGMADALRTVMTDDKLRKMLGENAVKINELLNVKKITDEWTRYVDRVDAG